ncbi:MAG: hypothetical protein Q9219_005633 [cf. Caloplaca sp. 3 TL-2023]
MPPDGVGVGVYQPATERVSTTSVSERRKLKRRAPSDGDLGRKLLDQVRKDHIAGSQSQEYPDNPSKDLSEGGALTNTTLEKASVLKSRFLLQEATACIATQSRCPNASSARVIGEVGRSGVKRKGADPKKQAADEKKTKKFQRKHDRGDLLLQHETLRAVTTGDVLCPEIESEPRTMKQRRKRRKDCDL